MKRPCVVVAVVVVMGVTVAGSAHAQLVGEGPVFNPENGHYYDRIDVPDGLTWFDAMSTAESMSFMGVFGHLATLTSQSENDFIVNQLGGNDGMLIIDKWLGGFQPPGSPEPDGGWEWITGEPWVFTNWAPGEPNEFRNDDEFALHFKWIDTGAPVGTWNDLNGNLTEWDGHAGHVHVLGGFIIEYPVPSGGVLGLLAVAGLLRGKRSRLRSSSSPSVPSNNGSD